MTVYEPVLTERGWEVEIVGYPESRTTAVHAFEDKDDADRFFKNAELGGLDLMEENEKLRTALLECEEYFDDRADAEYVGDPPQVKPSREMVLLDTVRRALGK